MADSLIMDELKLLRKELKSRLEVLSEQELDLLSRKRRLMQNEIKEDRRGLELDEREQAIQEREEYLLGIEKSVKEYSHVMKRSEEESTRHKSIAEENRRLKDSFATLCSANLRLKKQVEDQNKHCSSLRKRVEKLQTRLSSLHTMGIHHGGRGKCNPEGVDRGEDSAGPRLEDARQRTKATQTLQLRSLKSEVPSEFLAKADDGVLERLLSLMMELVLQDRALVKTDCASSEKFCAAFLPLLASALPKVGAERRAIVLHFVCWLLQCMTSDKRTTFSATLRRIGDICARGKLSFTTCPDIKARVCACVVVLQTISQADLLCLALDCLKRDLAEIEARALFLVLGGMKVLLPFFQPSSKFQVMSLAVLDIFVLVSSDSGLVHFLNKEWLTTAARVLNESQNSKLSEKLIILLQRLSTMRTGRELFEKCGVTAILQSPSSSLQSNAFIQLNIASILRNLGT